MTLQGTVNKTAMLLMLVVVSATFVWGKFNEAMMLGPEAAASAVQPWIVGGMIGSLIAAIATMFAKRWAMLLAPAYALFEGLMLGGISAYVETLFPGLVMQAVGLTFGTLFALLAAYKSGAIRATENFKLGVTAATGGVFLMYMASWILGFFGISIPFIHGSGIIGIGVSLVVVVIAALNLVLDFDFIENGADAGAPKYMEWYGAFGLVVTLAWLYLELLRLLMKLQSRD